MFYCMSFTKDKFKEFQQTLPKLEAEHRAKRQVKDNLVKVN